MVAVLVMELSEWSWLYVYGGLCKALGDKGSECAKQKVVESKKYFCRKAPSFDKAAPPGSGTAAVSAGCGAEREPR